MSDDLNPCPWCGEIPNHYEGRLDPFCRHDSIWRIAHECNTEAGLRIETLYYRTKDEATDAWNRRAKDAIVRCRDCKYADIYHGEHEYREPLFCAFHDMDVKPENFCSWGRKRKEQ